jgi:hypothetical protein
MRTKNFRAPCRMITPLCCQRLRAPNRSAEHHRPQFIQPTSWTIHRTPARSEIQPRNSIYASQSLLRSGNVTQIPQHGRDIRQYIRRATIRSPRARAAMPSLMDWIAGCPDRGGWRNEKNIRSLRTRDRRATQHRSIGPVNPDASLRLDGG